MASQDSDFFQSDLPIIDESSSSQAETIPGLEVIVAKLIKRSSINPTTRCYKYHPEKHVEFTSWWVTTEWFKDNQRKSGREKSTIHWNSQDRKSEIWSSVECQVATISNGHPLIICKRCENALAHPAIGQGTSTFGKHLSSKSCQKTAEIRGLKQLKLKESIPEQVGSCLHIYIHLIHKLYYTNRIVGLLETES